VSPYIGGMGAVSRGRLSIAASSNNALQRPSGLTGLHRTYGNQAVLRMLNYSHPSLNGRLQRKCACGGSGSSECAGCQEKREQEVQRAAAQPAAANTAPPIVHDVLRSSGQLLSEDVRAAVEPAFGRDFSHVRVHTDSKAAKSARAVNALAYTVGNQVVFGQGQYQPQTDQGRHLIAHELTHTIQQESVATDLSSSTAVQRQRDTANGNAATPPGFPPKDIDDFIKTWSSKLRSLKNLDRYGCYCGRGHICKDPKDDIDQCCKDHDDRYDNVHVNTEGGISMWTPLGLVLTQFADLALVGCLELTILDPFHWHGLEATAYRAAAMALFTARANLAGAIESTFPELLVGELAVRELF
jgi:Domain of unknown function (DUF4157)/Phospholipase A2